MKNHQARGDRPFDFLLLLLWFLLGLTLRLTNLDLKPASSIEIATIGYSLGHGFAAIPLDRVISPEMLAPLRLDSALGYADVFNRLMAESTHPPLYFWLTHWWLDLWLNDGDLTPLWVARSLSAIFGALAVPASFALGWVAFRSRLVAHFAAVLMAFSPYGVYLAQEARHYTLTILWIIASGICLVEAVRFIRQKQSLPIWLSCLWITVNALGVATHYFFVLALGAEAIAILFVWFYNRRQVSFKYWRGLYIAGCGTVAGCLIWLPSVKGVSNNEMTTWIQTSFDLTQILLPPVMLLGWIQSMVMLLPLQGVPTVVIIISMVVIESVAIWTVPKLFAGWMRSLKSTDNTGMLITSSYLIGSILLFLIIIYGSGRNLSLAARYHFVYFPMFILLIAVGLAKCWHEQKSKSAVVVLLTMGFFGSLTVINNYGYQKSRPSDLTAAFIQQVGDRPAVVAMSYNTYSQTRELISLAYSFNRLHSDRLIDADRSKTPKFLLNRPYIDGIDMGLYNLDRAIATQTKPLDLWAIDLGIGEASMSQIRCFKNETVELPEEVYVDRLYLCQN